MKRKILLFDIETFPNIAYVWGKYEQDVIEYKQHWYMLTFAWKWLGEKSVHALALRDFPLYKKDKVTDRELVRALWKLFDEAEVIIAHNGNSFDIKKSNARFTKHGFKPPSPYLTIDTKLVAKRYFKFDSNKLDDLGSYFKIGRKLSHEGFKLWLGCEANDPRAWSKMLKYNRQDVVLLEKVYRVMLPYMTTHPNYNLLMGTTHACPNCGSHNTHKRGTKVTGRTKISQRWHCKDCGAWTQGEKILR